MFSEPNLFLGTARHPELFFFFFFLLEEKSGGWARWLPLPWTELQKLEAVFVWCFSFLSFLYIFLFVL